jgi:glycosyltransferase involved in cell wall biosynthesis
VILQSHSPELPSEELKDLNYENNDVLLMQEIEIYAFNRANYIIFPNNDCVELYKKVLNKNCTIEYILSGCKKSDDVREYPIDKNFINILYIGRRNRIKGFDIVLREFEKAYKQRKDIRLIIAGNGSKIEQDGVVDIGFTTTPLNWFKSVDFVINANRQSYFDLSVLEVLSVGTPLILALNWGHKFFKNKSKGILTYEKPETELYEILMNLKFKNEHKESMIEDNLRLYNHLFTDTLYRERLEKLLLKIKTNI